MISHASKVMHLKYANKLSSLNANIAVINNVYRCFYQYLGRKPNTNKTAVNKSVNICTNISNYNLNSNGINKIFRNSTQFQLYHIRGFKNLKSKKPMKTRQAAAKRFIVTGKGYYDSKNLSSLYCWVIKKDLILLYIGKLKCGRSGKAHLNIGKSSVRLSRLNKKVWNN